MAVAGAMTKRAREPWNAENERAGSGGDNRSVRGAMFPDTADCIVVMTSLTWLDLTRKWLVLCICASLLYICTVDRFNVR